MIFSELYSAYYNAVTKIIDSAQAGDLTEKNMLECVKKEAFSESMLTIIPALKSHRWPLINDDLSTPLEHKPTVPLTNLEKRWLKAVSMDPKIQLFGIKFPELDDTEPLFTPDDYWIYDKYSDGDPFDNREYIRNFRLMIEAIRHNLPVKITMLNRHGKKAWAHFYPQKMEYSPKDDKFRVVVAGCKYRRFNLGRILTCEIYRGGKSGKLPQENPLPNEPVELVLMVTDQRNAMERAMLHFAHFEKQAERLEGDKYLLKLKYYEDDETEIVIRVLSFGPLVKVLQPQSFVNLIKQRLMLQKNCGLR